MSLILAQFRKERISGADIVQNYAEQHILSGIVDFESEIECLATSSELVALARRLSPLVERLSYLVTEALVKSDACCGKD